ncbi:hypothetical protein YC2023_007539 [Brassica napus]
MQKNVSTTKSIRSSGKIPCHLTNQPGFESRGLHIFNFKSFKRRRFISFENDVASLNANNKRRQIFLINLLTDFQKKMDHEAMTYIDNGYTLSTFDAWTGDACKNSRSFIRISSTIVELKNTTPTTMFVCGRGQDDFDYVVNIDANVTMNKEQEKYLKFVDRELKLDVSSPPLKPPVKTSQLLFPVNHTMDSKLNIIVDELGEAAVVRARHSPPP